MVSSYKVDYWKVLGKHWLTLIQTNEDEIQDLESKTKNWSYPNIKVSYQSIDFILHQCVKNTAQGDVQFPYMTAKNIVLND